MLAQIDIVLSHKSADGKICACIVIKRNTDHIIAECIVLVKCYDNITK